MRQAVVQRQCITPYHWQHLFVHITAQFSSHSATSPANLIGSVSHRRATSHTAVREIIMFLTCSHPSPCARDMFLFATFSFLVLLASSAALRKKHADDGGLSL